MTNDDREPYTTVGNYSYDFKDDTDTDQENTIFVLDKTTGDIIYLNLNFSRQ